MTRELLLKKWEAVRLSALPVALPISTEYIDEKLAKYGNADNVDKFLTTLYINKLTEVCANMMPDCRFMLSVAMDMSAVQTTSHAEPATSTAEPEQLGTQATA